MAEAANYDYLMEQDRLNVAVVGNGGRERALAWKLGQSARVGNVLLVPNNPDTAAYIADPERAIDLAVIGPDDALAAGIVDGLTARGIPAFGPTKQAAQIEASKPYAKSLMQANCVPTAGFSIFSDPDQAHAYIEVRNGPLYVKAGGLALGKGAVECATPAIAHQVVDDILVHRQFGDAGSEVVIEDYLVGQEVSLHAVCDGLTYRMFPSAQDHKKAHDGDTGPNTGGMGTLSPVPWFDQAAADAAGLTVVKPILSALQNEGSAFRGILFPGIMAGGGDMNVLEYNARFGDPETQVYMRRLRSDLLDIITATLAHRLDQIELKWSDEYAVCLVAASGGYPGKYATGKRITGIEAAEQREGIKVFLAGAAEQDGAYYTSGGRVLGVTAVGATLRSALDSAYAAMDQIQFEGKTVRSDIGAKALQQP